MNIVLFDSNQKKYFPLSLTRPVSDFRFGILTIKEKWEYYFKDVSVKAESYLNDKFHLNISSDNLWIDSQVIPTDDLIIELNNLREGEGLISNDVVIGFRYCNFNLEKINFIKSNANISILEKMVDLFYKMNSQLKNDFELLKKGKESEKLDNSNTLIGDNIFIEKGAKISSSILNSETGPIYIGKNAEIMEGSIIRGPFSLSENSVVKMGAKIYGPTSIGPNCKVGGEINNSVFFGFSSKAHDGFLGNSIIGEWCNLGADSNNSNLKNNYEDVKLWSYEKESFESTKLQFCGLIMGDHSKCGINTMFNTGTIVGVGVNVFGSGFPRNFIPSFSWGGAGGFSIHNKNKFFETAKKVFNRRSLTLDNVEQNLLDNVYSMTKRYRNEK
jgi:UDP-N-acetylglucosamine diphosphorylase/glucosamine-1-phosphate N-acetyltransferase